MTDVLHPRTVMSTQYWYRRMRELTANRKAGIISSYQADVTQGNLEIYLDSIGGTLPEKMLLHELLARGITVWFQWYIGDFPWTLDVKEKVRPDFILPDYHMIIQVDGVYWHSRSGVAQRDILQIAYLTAMGWDVRVVLDVDIYDNPAMALDAAVPELQTPIVTGNRFRYGSSKGAGTAAIAARIRKWPVKVPTNYKMARVGPRYVPGGRPPVQARRPAGPVFTGFTSLDADYVAKLKAWGLSYRQWVEVSLARWVHDVLAMVGHVVVDYIWIGDPNYNPLLGLGEVDPNNPRDAQGHIKWLHGYLRPIYYHLTEEEKALVAFYEKWKNWWKRFKL